VIVSLFSISSKKKQLAESFPRKVLGFSQPAKVFDYEFLICGKNVPYNQNQILRVFTDHGAMLLSLDSSVNASGDKFAFAVICNLENADSGPREIVTQLQAMKFVISAEYNEISKQLFGKRTGGIAINGRQAAVALSSSTMVSLGKRLASETGSLGTSALYQEGRSFVHQIAGEINTLLENSTSIDNSPPLSFETEISRAEPVAYCMKCRAKRKIEGAHQVLFSNQTLALKGSCPVCSTTVFKIGGRTYGKIAPSPLIENLQAFLLAAGWGAFELRSSISGRSGQVVISDPPTLRGDLSSGNQFLQGIAAGLLEIASSTRNPMAPVGESYERDKRTLTLNFAEEIPIQAGDVKSRSLKLKASTRVRIQRRPSALAEKEVDRIIRALESVELDTRNALKEEEEKSRGESPILPSP